MDRVVSTKRMGVCELSRLAGDHTVDLDRLDFCEERSRLKQCPFCCAFPEPAHSSCPRDSSTHLRDEEPRGLDPGRRPVQLARLVGAALVEHELDECGGVEVRDQRRSSSTISLTRGPSPSSGIGGGSFVRFGRSAGVMIPSRMRRA